MALPTVTADEPSCSHRSPFDRLIKTLPCEPCSLDDLLARLQTPKALKLLQLSLA